MSTVVVNKKISKKFNLPIGMIVSGEKAEELLKRYRADVAEEREAAYQAAKASGREPGKRVVVKPYNVGGRILQRGEVIYVTKINGNGLYRLQNTKSRQSVFATDSFYKIREYSELI